MKAIKILVLALLIEGPTVYAQTYSTTSTSGEYTLGASTGYYSLSIDAGSGKNLTAEITYSVDYETGSFYVFDYSTENYPLRSGIGYLLYTTSNSLGKMIVTLNQYSSGTIDRVVVKWSTSNAPTANQLSSYGPVIIQASTSSVNLSIIDRYAKGQNVASRSNDFTQAQMLIKDPLGNMLGLNTNKIASNVPLGIASTSSIYYNAVDHYFNTSSKTNALVILSDGNLKSLGNLTVGSTGMDKHILFNRSGSNYIAAPTGGSIRFVVNGAAASWPTQAFFIDMNGNVGIGVKDAEYATDRLQISGNMKSDGNATFLGNVGIGKSATSDQKLVVDGTIRAEEVKVETIIASQLDVLGDIFANKVKVATNNQTADFVFDDNYDLRSLAEIEQYIKEHKHLPNIPSAKEMEANGVDLAEMNKLLLQKIEELTLYVIELEKEKKSSDEVAKRLAKIESLLQLKD